MYDYIMRKQVVEDLKTLVEKVEEYENDTDAYCEMVRNFIINSYSEN